MSQVSYGTITITDTTDIERIYVEYCRSTSNQLDTSVNPPVVPNITVAWSENTPPWVNGQYIWQRSVVKKSGSTDLTYGTPVCLTGAAGATGAAGQSLTATKTEYTIAASNVTINLSNHTSYTWTTNTPDYDSSKPAYWGRITNTYTNPAKTEYLFYKDEALTKAVADAAIANSVAQHANEDAQGAMSQSANGIASIYRVWYRTNTATAPSKPPAHVTSAADDVNNTWTTVKPKENTDNRYYFYCEETVTNGGVSSWTNPVLDTSNLSQYEIGALTTKVKNFWWNSDGAHIASGINGADVDKNSPVSAYGFNSLVGLTGISFGYNNAKVIDLNTTPSPTSLKFYQPPTISGSTVTQGALAMELSSNALKFYGSSTSTPDATLNSTGLKLAKGGIIVNTPGANNGVYISSDNLGSKVTSLDSTKTNWRAVIGSKFGVDSEGNLYANNAKISGVITVQSGSNLSAGLGDYSTTTQMNQAIGDATEDMATTEYVEGLGYQTAEDVSGAVTSGIQNASVTNLSDGNNYSTTAAMNTAINTATGNLSTTISNTYATKTEAVVKEQRVYRRFGSAQSTFSGLNTWVTSGDGYTAWSTSVPQLTNGTTPYPFLYMSTQTQTATQAANNGTGCNFTTPQLNAMTTVIDGNSIIANSIAASKISVENLRALSADMGTLTAGKIEKGYNSINFDNTPATLEFKNQSTWDASTQGIRYNSNGLAIKGAITATQLTISGGGATYDGASAINANGYTIEIIEDKTVAPTGSVITENQTYLYPVMYLNGVAVTTGITKTNYVWYTNENTATTGGVAGDSTNGGIIATYGNTYRVTYNLSDDAVGTTPSQQTIHTSDARHITDISSSGITIHPEDGTAGNYMQLDSDGLKIYKSSTLLANYGTTVTIGSSSAKNVYIDSNGVQIRDSATSLAEFGTTARIGQSTSSRFLMNSDSLQAYDHDNSLYFEVNSNGLTWGSGNTAATTTQVNTAAQTATNFLSFDDTNGLQLASSSPSTATRKVQILSDAIRIKNNDTNYLNIDSTGIQLHKGGRKIADFGTNIILGPKGGPHTEITSSNVDFYVRSGLSSRKAMSIENDGCFKVYQSDNSPIMIAGKLDSWSGILLGGTDLNTTGGRLLGSGNSYGDDTHTTHRATLSLSAYAESPTGTGYASGSLSLTASANNGRNSNHIIISGSTDGTGGIESSTTIVVNSDERLKENCISVNHISNLLLKIQPIIYSWKDKRITQRCFGFKAQDVRTALNEVVKNVDDYALVSKNDNGYYNLSYTELIPLIVDIIQKQEKRIAELEIKLEGRDE